LDNIGRLKFSEILRITEIIKDIFQNKR